MAMCFVHQEPLNTCWFYVNDVRKFLRKIIACVPNYKALRYTELNLLACLLAYLLTPRIRDLHEKLRVSQLVRKCSKFYKTRRSITAFTKASLISLSWTRSVQSILTSRRSILILSSHLRLCLPSVLLPLSFPTTTLHASRLSSIRAACPANFILLNLITRMILARSTEHKAPYYVVFSSLLWPCLS